MADILGIDVSEFQGTLDWSKIKAAGIRFAIIRGGYGRYAVDGQFENNIRGAIENGIPVGVYWFSYALCAEGAREEARKCLSLLTPYRIQLPVFYDFEYDTVRYAGVSGDHPGTDPVQRICSGIFKRSGGPGLQGRYLL